jgi:HK97 family phage prohead protease
MADDTMVEEYQEDQRLAICSLQLEEERDTNFPTKDEDKKVSLKNSNYPQFDYDYALKLKEDYPSIWKAGGNIRGNDAFMLWGRARDGQETEAITEWIKEREAWIARHYEDGKQFKGDKEPNLSNVGGVVAQIKWGVIGTLGESGMKEVISELKKKIDNKEDKFIDMKNKEIRTIDVQDLELRMDGDNPVVVGYGAVFNSMSNDLGGFREYIGSEAFEGRLEDDVRFLINHDGMPLARTTNGTLRLSVDERGLKYEAKLNPNVSTSRDLMELLKDGTINQSSFAFIVEDDSWEMKDGMNVRTINKVSRLYDVSAVTYPAYNEASSSVALRSMQEWQEKEEAKKLEESLEAEKLEGIKEEEDLKQRSLNEMRLKILKNKY